MVLTDNQSLTSAAPATGPQTDTMPGVTNVGSLTLGAQSTLTIRVQDVNGAAGIGYDLMHVSRTLTLNGGTSPGTQIVISLASLGAGGNPGAALNFDATRHYEFVLVQADTAITGYVPGEFAVDTSAFQNSLGGETFDVLVRGNQLLLEFAVVPEQGVTAMLLAGIVLAACRSVRSRKGRA